MMKLAVLVFKYELGIWKSLYLWIFRRPVTKLPGDQPFGYTQAVTPVLWAFIAISAIEIPIFHLLIPWETVRGIGLVFGAWGLIWMIGLLASQKKHPHLVGDEGIRVRNGFNLELFIPWSNIEKISRKNRNLDKGRTIQEDGDVLSLVVFSQTNVDIVLREPMTLRRLTGDTQPFTELRIFADDPAALTVMAQRLLPSSTH